MQYIWYYLGLSFFIITVVNALASKTPNNYFQQSQLSPPATGNFSLPSSQQPGPLIGFGQNIIDQNELQLGLNAGKFSAFGINTNAIAPYLLYGITNRFSIYFALPVDLNKKQKQEHSLGLDDAILQLEYAFYVNTTAVLLNQATIVGNISIPSGSPTKKPATGLGSPSFFLGTTLSRMYVDWFVFTAYGATFTTAYKKLKAGNSFLYQGGIGRNILTIDSQCLFALLLEVDGQYTGKDHLGSSAVMPIDTILKISYNISNFKANLKGTEQFSPANKFNPNSGGNEVFVVPSLLFATRKFTAQLGVGFPITQHLFGNQQHSDYLVALDLLFTLI